MTPVTDRSIIEFLSAHALYSCPSSAGPVVGVATAVDVKPVVKPRPISILRPVIMVISLYALAELSLTCAASLNYGSHR